MPPLFSSLVGYAAGQLFLSSKPDLTVTGLSTARTQRIRAMRGSSRYAWGPFVVGAYIVLALAATCLLVPLWVTGPEGSVSRYDAMVDVARYWRDLVLVSLVLLVAFAGLGLVVLVAVGTVVDEVTKAVKTLNPPKRTDRGPLRER
jgi:hypothetical protein